jgi:hypothetical protein
MHAQVFKARPGDEAMSNETPSDLIDRKIAGLGDWRGETLSRLRALIHEADPDVEETVKWAKAANPLGVPVWEHAGIICTGELYRDKVKLTFAQAPRWTTRRACSTPASTATPAARSTSRRAGCSTPTPSGR